MTKSKTVQWKFLKLNGEIDRRYKVSNEGEIFNVKKGVLVKAYAMQKKSPFNGSDYQQVYVAGKLHRLHRIVCETFHGQAPAGKDIVLHSDEYKDHNHKDNLKWGTLGENSRDFYASRNGKPARYSEAKIRRVKTLINKGYTNDKVATMTKVGDSSVSLIKMGRSRRTVLPLTNRQVELGNV